LNFKIHGGEHTLVPPFRCSSLCLKQPTAAKRRQNQLRVVVHLRCVTETPDTLYLLGVPWLLTYVLNKTLRFLWTRRIYLAWITRVISIVASTIYVKRRETDFS